MATVDSDLSENKDLHVNGDTAQVDEAEDQEEVPLRRTKRRFPRQRRQKTGYINYDIPDEFQEHDKEEETVEEVDSNGNETVRVDSSISYEERELNTETKFKENETEDETIAHVTEEFSKLCTPMLDRNSITYDIHKYNYNLAFIFNQKNINGYLPRYGTEKDVDALKDSFGTLGFHVEEPFNDFTRDEILTKLEDISTSDFTEYGCLVIIFLTHGSSRGILKAKDRNFYESEVLEFFKGTKNESLLSKPKIFIIQACRGTEVSHAAYSGQSVRKIEHDASLDLYTLPAEADFLVVHSTYAGNVSHRHTKNGTWFIETLCKWIKNSPSDMEVNVLLTRIKHEVAINKEHEVYDRVTQQNEINKQMPIYYTTLTRDLYLKKHIPEDAITPSTDDQKYTVLDKSNINGNTSPVSFQYHRMKSVPIADFRRQHFEYLRERLRHFCQDYNMEEHAQHLINIADAVDVSDDSSAVRVIADQTSKEIATFLRKHAANWLDLRSVFFYDI